jgi:hypothetical protein
MTNYYWLIQSERAVGYTVDGRKEVRVAITPAVVTNTSTPPGGISFNASGLVEVVLGSLDEVMDFSLDRNYIPVLPNFVIGLNAWKDAETPPASSTTGLTAKTPKNGIVLLAQKVGLLSGATTWGPIASGDLANSSNIIIEAWGI